MRVRLRVRVRVRVSTVGVGVGGAQLDGARLLGATPPVGRGRRAVREDLVRVGVRLRARVKG